ncbi:hypothetical protein QE416_000643 [Microbacterium sp. SORGH_AS 421]|nr:hypothetical protein [Microbacterium sp. SORGH_AS_0421]
MSSAFGGVGGGEADRGRTAVLQNGDAFADLADLLEPVRDVDDGDTRRGELPHDREEVLDLFGVEHGGGLVHDDQLDVVRQGARHAHDLLVRGAERADLGVRREVGVAESAKELFRLTGRLGALGETAARELVPEEDVLGDRQAVDDVELLVHRGYPELDGRVGIGDLDVLAEPDDLALVGAVDARERLDESRLARAVLAQHAVHLSGDDVEIDTAQGADAGEGLGHASDGE